MVVDAFLRNQMVTPGAGFFDGLALIEPPKPPQPEMPIQLAAGPQPMSSMRINEQYRQATGTTLTDGAPIQQPQQQITPRPVASQPIRNQMTQPSGYAMPDSEPVIKNGAQTLFGR